MDRLDDDVFRAGLEAWRREHDLWRKRAERADDQAAALLAVDVTALAALGTVIGVVLRDQLRDWLPGLFVAGFGALLLLLVIAIATMVRLPGWAVAEREREETNAPPRRFFPRRWGPEGPDWAPRSDWLFLIDVPVERWAEGDWRASLIRHERERTESVHKQAKKKELWLGEAVALLYLGMSMALVGLGLIALAT